MAHLIVVEGHAAQRRQIEERLGALTGKEGYVLAGKFEAGGTFAGWKELVQAAEARGLFAERQVTVSEGSEALGPFPEELIPLLEPRGAEAVVLAAFTGDAKKTFGKEVMGRAEFLQPEPEVSPWKRKGWLLDLAREMGYRLAPDAAALLGESVESQEELRGELSKLGLYADGREIRLEDVRALCFDEGARSQLTFLDGVCQARPRDVTRSGRNGQSIRFVTGKPGKRGKTVTRSGQNGQNIRFAAGKPFCGRANRVVRA